MSEEVETTPVPPAEILPAKSEDKLIIEKEEKESEQQEQKSEDNPEEKVEEEENGIKNDNDEKPDTEGDEKGIDEDKKDEVPEDKDDEEKDGDDNGKESRSRKKFKIPNVELKAPKVPGFSERFQRNERRIKMQIKKEMKVRRLKMLLRERKVKLWQVVKVDPPLNLPRKERTHQKIQKLK